KCTSMINKRLGQGAIILTGGAAILLTGYYNLTSAEVFSPQGALNATFAQLSIVPGDAPPAVIWLGDFLRSIEQSLYYGIVSSTVGLTILTSCRSTLEAVIKKLKNATRPQSDDKAAFSCSELLFRGTNFFDSVQYGFNA